MTLLPNGVTVELAKNKRTGELCWDVTFTQEYIMQTTLNILNERIERAEVALKVCKHTKRKHRLTKLYDALIKFRDEQQEKLNNLVNDELPTRFEGSE